MEGLKSVVERMKACGPLFSIFPRIERDNVYILTRDAGVFRIHYYTLQMAIDVIFKRKGQQATFFVTDAAFDNDTQNKYHQIEGLQTFVEEVGFWN